MSFETEALTFSLEDPLPVQTRVLSLLRDYIQPNSTKSLEETAQSLDDLHPDKRTDDGNTRESADDFVYAFWEPVHLLAQRIPHDHPAMDMLVQVLMKLRDLPPRQVNVGGWGDFKLWTDLPLLGETYTTFYDKIRAEDNAFTKELNFVSFGARLMANAIPLDRFCIYSISTALEGHYDPTTKGSNRAIVTDPAQIPDVDHKVALMAEWFRHAGHAFYQKGPVEGGSICGPLMKGPGKNEFSNERWRFWKQRLLELVECDSLKEDTRALAKDTITTMDKVEAGR